MLPALLERRDTCWNFWIEEVLIGALEVFERLLQWLRVDLVQPGILGFQLYERVAGCGIPEDMLIAIEQGRIHCQDSVPNESAASYETTQQ